jgi:alpha-tubulin suppressor-like RCC1 family protein
MGFAMLAGAQNYTCALKTEGSAWCFGADLFGSLGIGSPGTIQTTPVRLDFDGEWVAISADTFATCAIESTGALYCWGRNTEGQLGVGDTTDRDTPTAVTLSGPWLHVSVGRFHMCAVDRARAVYCTGENRQGQLGLGDTVRRNELTRVEF